MAHCGNEWHLRGRAGCRMLNHQWATAYRAARRLPPARCPPVVRRHPRTIRPQSAHLGPMGPSTNIGAAQRLQSLTRSCSGRQNKVSICFFRDFGRILVRDVVHWIRIAETPNLPVFFASVAFLTVSFVPKSIFWNPAEKSKNIRASKTGNKLLKSNQGRPPKTQHNM